MFSLLVRRSFSKLSQISDVLSNFKHNISLHEHESSAMKINPAHLIKVPASDIVVNTIAAGFLAKVDHFEMLRYSDRFTQQEISSPSSSFIQIQLPLEKIPDLQRNFIRFRPDKIRVGRLLEALDFMANYVAYRHCKTQSVAKQCTMMTVCVDHLKFFRNLRADKNITINAYPTFSGNSTVEIRTDLFQVQENGENIMVSSSFFVMAARDFHDFSKPFMVRQLVIDKEEDKDRAMLRFELGKLNQTARKTSSSASLFQSPPSQEETNELHDLFQTPRPSSVRMKETLKTKSLLMYNQDKNINGKIFGGYLMRESIEFAWLVAYMYSDGDHPEFEAIDDFNFVNSIDVGSIVDFEAQVTFVESFFIHVQVIATKTPRVLKEGEKEKQKCTELHITFKCYRQVNKSVVPSTYEDSMKYLEAKRRVLKEMELNIE